MEKTVPYIKNTIQKHKERVEQSGFYDKYEDPREGYRRFLAEQEKHQREYMLRDLKVKETATFSNRRDNKVSEDP